MTERQRFLRFLAVGTTAALVNILSRVVFNTAMSYELSILLAYVVAMIVAYSLNRRLVFNPSGRSVQAEVAGFVFVNAISAAQVWIVSITLARAVFPATGFEWNAETIAHIIGVGSPVFTSYLGHKHISFREKR